MTLPTSRTSSLQSYSLALFRSAIHPEFFRIDDRTRIAHGGYEFEAWIFRGGHALRFEHNGMCVTEVVSEELDHLPQRGHVTTLPCAGERDHEETFSESIGYLASIQTETLTDHLYLSTYNEMLEHGRTGDCLMSVWTDDAHKPNLSLVDVQRYGDEVHAQTYHLRSDCGLVLRAQTIFQVKT
jgi:hypothetical protein